MSGPPHHCPGCGAPQPHFPRYPWYFCPGCLRRAEDGSGRRLAFFNAGLSGGLCWCLASEARGFPGGPDVGAVLCLIDGRPVLVQEARMGGVVAQPVTHALPPGWPAPGARGVDLTRAGP